MNTDTKQDPQPFKNGAGRTAMVDGKPVYKGTRITVYGRAYTVQSAQPNGTGFRLFAHDADGKLFEFKTSEVRLADDGSKTSALAAAYPLVNIVSKPLSNLLECKLQNQPEPSATKAVLAAAGWVQAIHAKKWTEAAAYLVNVKSDIGRDPNEFFREFSRAHSVISPYYQLTGVPAWLPALTAAQPATASPAPVLAPRPSTARKPRVYKPGHNNGDMVAAYMAGAADAEQAMNLYRSTGATDADELAKRYKNLQLGLLKMSLANRLRRAVAAGSVTIPNKG